MKHSHHTPNKHGTTRPSHNGVITLDAPLHERVRWLTGSDSAESLGDFLMLRLANSPIETCQVLFDTGCNQDGIHCFLGEKQPITNLVGVEQLVTRDLPCQGIRPSLYLSEPFTTQGRRGDDLKRFDEYVAFVVQHQRQLLLSNGVGIDEDVARILAKHASLRLYVSLMGSCAQTHETITRSPGSFRRNCDALPSLSSLKRYRE